MKSSLQAEIDAISTGGNPTTAIEDLYDAILANNELERQTKIKGAGNVKYWLGNG